MRRRRKIPQTNPDKGIEKAKKDLIGHFRDSEKSPSFQSIGQKVGRVADSYVQSGIGGIGIADVVGVFMDIAAVIDTLNKKSMEVSTMIDTLDKKSIPSLLSSKTQTVSSVDPPEPWKETIWRKIQKKIFPSSYRRDLQYNAQLWERYIRYIEDGTIPPLPFVSVKGCEIDTGPR